MSKINFISLKIKQIENKTDTNGIENKVEEENYSTRINLYNVIRMYMKRNKNKDKILYDSDNVL